MVSSLEKKYFHVHPKLIDELVRLSFKDWISVYIKVMRQVNQGTSVKEIISLHCVAEYCRCGFVGYWRVFPFIESTTTGFRTLYLYWILIVNGIYVVSSQNLLIVEQETPLK